MPPSRPRLAGLPRFLTLALLVPACGGAAAPMLGDTTPTGVDEALGDVDCGKVRAQEAPDLMGWDPASRANLDRMRRQGMVAVRYEKQGCEVKLELLPNCKVRSTRSAYAWTPYSANETKVLKSRAELFAQLPLGAVGLSGRMAGERSLRTDVMLVGTRSVPVGKTISTDQLEESDDCRRATHVVTTIYYGGFALASGAAQELEAQATVFGAGAGGASKESQELLSNEGNAPACKKAQESGEEQPTCNVPLRVNLAPIEGRQTASGGDAAAGAPPASGAAGAAPFTGQCPTGMLPVQPGRFRFGTRDEAVTVAGFCMDATETTAAAYGACVSGGKCLPPAKTSAGCTYGQAGMEQHPITCTTADEAERYCAAQGKRLPTDREWEYAARGGDGRAFPWGAGEPEGKACFARPSEGPCAVGSHPDGKSPFGVLDLAGNVGEWTSTAEGEQRSVRGGDYADKSASALQATRSVTRRATQSEKTIGFRCVR